MEMTDNRIILGKGLKYRHITLGTRVKVIEVTDNYVTYRKIVNGEEYIKPRYVFEQMYRNEQRQL